MAEENISKKFRLKRNYFIEEVKQNELIIKSTKKVFKIILNT